MEEKKLHDDTEIDVGMIEKSILFDKEQNKEQHVWLLKGSIWKTYSFSKILDLIHRLQSENDGLQKQVDELREQNAQLSELADYDKGHKEGYEHGEKTTAKEILQGFNKWLKQGISDSYDKSVKGSFAYQGGRNNAFHEVKELVKKVAESKGVEVE